MNGASPFRLIGVLTSGGTNDGVSGTIVAEIKDGCAGCLMAVDWTPNGLGVNGGVKTCHWGGAKVGQFGVCALERAALI